MRALITGMVVAMAMTFAIGPANAGDAAKGKRVYNKCKACHSMKPGKKKIGPSLHGVMGRKAGTLKGFKFSKAMKKSGITWDDKSMGEYLKKPRAFVKGTKMAFPGLKKAKQIDDVIAYIKSKSK
jgi:cytochrome c